VISSQVQKEQGRTRGVQCTQQHRLRQTIWGYQFMIIKMSYLGYIAGGIYTINNSSKWVWDEYERKRPCWEVEGQLREAFMQSYLVHARLLSLAFYKMVITHSSEVKMMCHLLGLNLDYKELITMYHLCHTWFSKGNQMHLICVPGSSLHTYDWRHEWNINKQQ
jgi:hypothetical protein